MAIVLFGLNTSLLNALEQGKDMVNTQVEKLAAGNIFLLKK